MTAIQSSVTPADLKQLKTLLSKEETILLKNLPVLDEVLNILDPAAHSLGWTYILCAKLTSKIDPNKFITQSQKFLVNCVAAQIRLSPNKFSFVCRKFAEVCIETGQAMRAIKPLRGAIAKLKPSPDSLTSVHADLVQVCLLSKCYNAALPILEEEILDVNPDVTAVTARDFLLYFYYGGMIYTGLKQLGKALIFYRNAITAPAVAMSSIMVEAYKKYILLSLLVNGKMSALPRHTSSILQRHHKTGFPQYNEFATVFGNGNTDELHKVAQAHSEVFQKDRNFGIVKQCIQSLYRKNIQQHTQTYITFSLQDIATSVKLPSAQEAEKQVLSMIEDGEIFATINQKDGMVAFHEDPEQYDTTSTLIRLDSQIQKAIELGKKVKSMDETIACSQNYLQKTSMYERGGGRWSEIDDFEGAERPPGIGGPMKM